MDARSGNITAPSAETPVLETLGQLTGQFAHDINNLLASVLVGIELAGHIERDERVRRLLDGVAESIQRQRALTAAMAHAARACERLDVFDAHALIESCSGDLRALLGATVLELRLDAADARIRCDAAFLRTALLHLCLNARAALSGGGRLVLATRNRDAPGTIASRMLALSAIDDGDGMSEDVRRRAFEPFFSTRAGAHGLGLAQVRDTARRAGGSIAVETLSGQGTAISMLLPLAD